jgi:hypothetical protein
LLLTGTRRTSHGPTAREHSKAAEQLEAQPASPSHDPSLHAPSNLPQLPTSR